MPLPANPIHADQTSGSHGDVNSHCRTQQNAGNSAITPIYRWYPARMETKTEKVKYFNIDELSGTSPDAPPLGLFLEPCSGGSSSPRRRRSEVHQGTDAAEDSRGRGEPFALKCRVVFGRQKASAFSKRLWHRLRLCGAVRLPVCISVHEGCRSSSRLD